MRNALHVARVLGISVGLISHPVAMGTVPRAAPAQARSPATDVASRLADLLRSLDQDQSRRVTELAAARAVAGEAFPRTNLAEVARLLDEHSGPAVVIFAQRGQFPESPMVLEKALLVAAQPGGKPSTRSKPRARDAFFSSQGGNWSGVLASLQSARPDAFEIDEEATRAQAMTALNTSRSAAFVFLLSADRRTVARLILVPDTVRISVTGDRNAPPESRHMPNRAMPPPPRPTFEPPPRPFVPPMPEPPEPPEPVPPPDEPVE